MQRYLFSLIISQKAFEVVGKRSWKIEKLESFFVGQSEIRGFLNTTFPAYNFPNSRSFQVDFRTVARQKL